MEGGQTKNADSQFISFQDFPNTMVHGSRNNQTNLNLGNTTPPTFDNLTSDVPGVIIAEDLPRDSSKPEDSTARNFWTIEYYQKFFDVNTNDVLERIKQAVIPHTKENYLISQIRPNPDLYGPFWICITLVFSIAISGNVANYLQTANSNKHHWKYDFHLVSYAATCIFLYAWLLPMGLWGALKWTTRNQNMEEELIQTHATPGLLELLCLYGYSLAIYIPTTFLLAIQIGWLQWILILFATVLSGGILVRSLLPVVEGRHRLMYIAVILGMHLLLAAGFMFYFFHMPIHAENSVMAVPEQSSPVMLVDHGKEAAVTASAAQ